MTTQEPPGTGFVARYGLVRYADYLGDRYPREGPCELGVCRIRRAEDMQRAAQHSAWLREYIPRELAGLDALLAGPIADPRLAAAHARRRDRLALQLRRMDEVPAEPPPATRAAVLVFDHCHVHGWVRGIVCMACNNALGNQELRDVYLAKQRDGGSAEAAAMLVYLVKCPDCASEDATGPVLVTS